MRLSDTFDENKQVPSWIAITITEACQLFHVHPTTIYWHRDMGNIRSRKSGKIWLVSYDDLRNRYHSLT